MIIESDDNGAFSKFMANFSKEEKLGEGTYGVVTRAYDKKKGKLVALKKLKLDNCEDEGIPSTTIREIAILTKLKHQNIVQLYEVKYFMQEKKLFLIFESLHTDLKKYLDKTQNISMYNVKGIIYQILLGLSYCHSRRVLHRDLKPQNILVSELMNVKLADFGLSRVFQFPMPKFTKEIATLWYRSPELMLGDDNYGTGVDIWAVGCILAECLNGHPLFTGDSQIDMLFKMMEVINTIKEQLLGTPCDQNYVGLSKLPYFKLTFPKFQAKDLSKEVPQLENDKKGLEVLESML